MTRDTVITRRAGALASLDLPLGAAILAADAAASEGLRPQDVRFFFLLFSNWMGDDRLRPGVDMHPTQVRRALVHLADQGLAVGAGGRPPRWSLTTAGVLRLVDTVTDARAPRRFEEVVLLATVATAYVDVIAARVRGGGGGDERRVRARLDARAILRAERARLQGALDDMEDRRRAGPELAAIGRAALAAGDDAAEAAARVEAAGPPYQLHPMRPYREVIAGLPPSLRRFELERGPELRSRSVFGPLADELRARVGILERLEEDLRRTVGGAPRGR